MISSKPLSSARSRKSARLTGAALAPLPAVWVCIGLTVLIFGLWPQWTSLAWGALLAFLAIGELGPILGLPEWVQDLSPFSYLPSLPGGAFSALPLVGLAAVAFLLVGGGGTAFRRRDVG